MASMNLHLSWDGPGGSQALDLDGDPLLIGRQESCDIVLDDPQVSREHARLRFVEGAAVLEDLASRNGVRVNGDRIESIELRSGDEFSIGATSFRLGAADLNVTQAATVIEAATVLLENLPGLDAPAPAGASAESIVPAELLEQAEISEQDLLDRGVEVRRAEFVALGGGMGNFAWVDMLRNCGVSAEDIIVVGRDEHAIARYRRLCENSQIPEHERLRSHSESCPDNIWGFPGYSMREAWSELRRGHLRGALAPVRGVFGEPVLNQTWTPTSGQVYEALDREEARIGWESMRLSGRIRAIRKSTEGRLLAVISQSDDQERHHLVVSARFMHLATGYPAIQLLPDLGEYRERTGDRQRVVNAYEEHDYIYEKLAREGGSVLIRGRGIVASRVIQSLVEARTKNSNVQIIHLHRSNLSHGNQFGRARRLVADQFETQPFNWPKACWGGELRRQIENSDDQERKRLLDVWGGTTTADRRDWRQMISTGVKEGWYRAEYGTVESVDLKDDKVVSRVSSRLGGGGTLELTVDYVIDCTGLVAGLDRSPLLADLVSTYKPPLNAIDRLRVSEDFEVEALQNGEARFYAAGAMTMGGPFAPVDSFLGLQFAAVRSVDAIRKQVPKRVRRLNGLYSTRQWLRWARGVAP